MAIDWENLLDAEGADLQAAYDDLCYDAFWAADNDDWENEPPISFDPVPESLRGTRAAGEIILATSAPFRSGRLRLYCEAVINSQPINYLVAADRTPLLAILLTGDGSTNYKEDGLDGIPLLWLPREDMERGDPKEAISRLTSILADRREIPGLMRHRIDPIPPELHARMADLRMIWQRDGHLWVPTEYGRGLGVVDGYLPLDGEGGYCHALFICTADRPLLDEALAFGRQRRENPFRGELPWARTLERARQGLPRSDAYAAGIARDFAMMPLAEYMASFPNELEFLRGEFEFDSTATFQEVADCLLQFYERGDASDERNERFMDLLSALAKPILVACGTMPPPTN